MRSEFLDGRYPGRSGVATAHNLYRTMGNMDVFTDAALLEVKVPINFLGFS
jgi:hypothetical protein